MYTCFLFGHSDAPDFIQAKLDDAVEYHVAHLDVTEFVVGNYGNFDCMAVRAIQKAKQRHPDIYAYLLIPYFFDTSEIPIPEGFENTYHPLELLNVPKRFAIPRGNRFMVDDSDYVITYAYLHDNNYGKLLQHARARMKKGFLRQILNLADTIY